MNLKDPSIGRALATGAALCALLVGVTACGDSESADSGDAARGASMGATTVKAAIQPAIPFAPVFLGAEKGFFEEEGIDLEIEPGVSGQTIFPSLLAGQHDIGSSTWGTVVAAWAKDLPLMAIAPGDVVGSDPSKDYSQLVVLKESGIKTFEELEGKIVGLGGLRSMSEGEMRAIAKRKGVDADKLEFIAVPFPEMGATLRAGEVDAMVMVDPFLTQLKQEVEVNVLAGTNAEAMTDMPVSVLVASRDFVDGNADTLRKFQLGISKSYDYANAHPDEVRELLTKITKLDPGIAGEVALPVWTTDMGSLNVQGVADLMNDTGIVDKDIDVSPNIAEFPISAG